MKGNQNNMPTPTLPDFVDYVDLAVLARSISISAHVA
jgi:hypothetical protein